MEVPGRAAALALWGGFPALSSSSSPSSSSFSSFRLPCPLVGAGFDIKWDSPARKKVKDQNSVRKKELEGTINLEIGRPQGDAKEPAARLLLAARLTDLDEYEAPREPTHTPKLLLAAFFC